MRRKLLGLATWPAIILVLSLVSSLPLANPDVTGSPRYTVTYNPYAGIDWNNVFQLKTQLHGHTTESDGGNRPYTVINHYAAYGYDALGISDHNKLTWPWTEWAQDINPAAWNMIALPNEEVTLNTTHFTAPFLTSAINGFSYGTDIQEALNAANDAGGVPIIAHPWAMGYSLTTCDNWTGFQGIEIYNPTTEGGFRSFDFELWDHLLTNPGRPEHVWGFAVDDSHDIASENQGWIVVYAQRRDAASIENSIIAGSFIAVVNSSAKINSITQVGNTLVVNATSPVVWKADGQQIVERTNTLDLDTLKPGYTYVRAEVDGEIFTQPIFITQDSSKPTLLGDVNGPAGVPDGRVDIRDLATIAERNGGIYPNVKYKPEYDLSGDGRIDSKDLRLASLNFGKYVP